MDISSGTKLGRYEIRSQLGAGGMGQVYVRQGELLSGSGSETLPDM